MNEPKRTYRLQDSMPTFDQQAADEEIQAHRKSILVVEDEEDLNYALSCQLRQAGFFVVSSFDALSGLQQTGYHRPDLVLIDLVRPNLADSGFLGGFLDLERMKSVPVILLATDASPALEQEASLLGVTEFLSKPIAHSEVIARIEHILGIKPDDTPN